MEDIDSIEDGDRHVHPCTEEAAFEPIKNIDSCQLWSQYMVSKLEVTMMPYLDKFKGDDCSKSAKVIDKAINHIQALMLDATYRGSGSH